MPSSETLQGAAPQPAPGAQLERVPVVIFDEPAQLAREVAERVATLVREGRPDGRPVVLGLPTGSTPIGVYQNLIRMHREEGLDFSNVVTFNIDEYYPMDPGSFQSYHRFMWENLFDHVNIPKEHIHIPRGDLQPDQVDEFCRWYEAEIQRFGGLDLILLGIGRDGHIGFNEPGSGPETLTRLIVLDEITRKDAASDFFGEENVPRTAVTMGVGTILAAREVILMATGEHKAPIIKRAVEEEPNKQVTATFLQLHAHASFFVDRAAAGELTREKTPWLVREVEWNDELSKRAVIWLSQKLGKAILTLEKADFEREHLHDLVHTHGDSDELCRTVFEDLRRRVAYRQNLFSGERVILFSPHPDDDVISMGGMLDKLVRNGNMVTVAYMTNGSVAVFDSDVRRFLRFVRMGENGGAGAWKERAHRVFEFLETKQPGEVDTEEVQQIKAHIRYAEAIAGLEVMGLGEENARFLDMPFYKTGRVKKDPIGPADVKVVLDLLEEIEPTHIFVAGDLSDPHGTHRMCYVAIREALDEYHARRQGENGERRRRESVGPMVWLYRGAWQEWEIHQADVFLPLSKADMDRKVEAIFKHESQKDRAMFPGGFDPREFWQRARDRNTTTAKQLDCLGLPEFYAAEAFVTTYAL